MTSATPCCEPSPNLKRDHGRRRTSSDGTWPRTLRRLVEGDLAGMIDGLTSEDPDLTAPVVSLNLRSVHESDALGILMVCTASWLKRAVDDGVKRILVVDEAWATC